MFSVFHICLVAKQRIKIINYLVLIMDYNGRVNHLCSYSDQFATLRDFIQICGLWYLYISVKISAQLC